MSDLISRDEVLEMLQGLDRGDGGFPCDDFDAGWGYALDNAIEGLEDIPTTYDVDKVWNEITDRAGKATTKGAYRTYWECAKIVKGGGQG